MPKTKLKSRRKKPPKRVLALPDLEQAKSAVLNSLTSASGQRTYDHAITEFVAWYCSEPRLAWRHTIFAAPAPDFVTWPVANLTRSSSSPATCPSRPRSDT
jgi:hypothetical protein